jgi:hypothetical protein
MRDWHPVGVGGEDRAEGLAGELLGSRLQLRYSLGYWFVLPVMITSIWKSEICNMTLNIA